MTLPAGSGAIDAHVHVASDDEAHYPRHPTGMASDWWRRGCYQVDDVRGTLMEAGVAQMVIVQAAGVYGEDNRYVVDMAGQHRESVRAVVVVDPDAPGASATITELASLRGVAGVRCMAVRPSATWVGTTRTDEAFESAAEAGLTVVLTVFGAHLPLLRPTMERFPDVRVVLDHCAFPAMEGLTMGRDDPLRALADLPQVTVKITSHNLAPVAETGGGRPFVEQLVGWFGTHRMLWGSDYPQTHHDTYAGLVDLAVEAFADLSPHEVAGVLGDNTRHLFGFTAEVGRP
jgi:predicted TIM-barrel fold metal-dependent hydrolase